MAAVLGAEREAAVARELTKKFEEVHRGTLGELARHYAEAGVRGEIVLVVGPPGPAPPASAEDLDAALAEALLRASLKDAVREVTARLGLSRREVYARALALSRGKG